MGVVSALADGSPPDRDFGNAPSSRAALGGAGEAIGAGDALIS